MLDLNSKITRTSARRQLDENTKLLIKQRVCRLLDRTDRTHNSNESDPQGVVRVDNNILAQNHVTNNWLKFVHLISYRTRRTIHTINPRYKNKAGNPKNGPYFHEKLSRSSRWILG